MKIAFDIDNTLWVMNNRNIQEPNELLLQVLRWFCANGDEVHLWSSGGIDYVKEVAEKLLKSLILAIIIPIWILLLMM